jgi:hypothetical protein
MNLRCFNPQFFIASGLGDAALAQEEGLRATSFDSQMSTAIPTGDLWPADRRALDRLKALGHGADTGAVRDRAGDAPLTTADVDDLIQRLRRLRREDPGSADQILSRLVEEAGRT